MYDKITLPSLVTLLSEKTGKSKKLCEDFLREFFGTLVNTLGDGENVKIKGIGTFKVVEVEPRKSVNVNTGEEMEIPGHRKITFTPAKEMADDVNSPFALFESVEIDDDAEEVEESVTVEEPEEVEKPVIVEAPIALKEPEALKKTEEVKSEEEPVAEEESEEEEVAEEEPVAEEESEEEEVAEEEPVKEEVTEEPSEEEVAEETPDESFPEYEYYDEEPKKKYHFLWGFLCGLFCTAIVVAICYFFLADKFNAMMGSFQDKEPTATPVAVATQPVPADTVNETSDSIPNDSIGQKIVEDKDVELKDVAPTKPSDEKVYDTISQTRYLTTMAKAHYGNYNLWPIIYEENKAMLGHPDRIRPGTRVVIPPLSKYGVDPNNPDDIAKAKKKGVEIYARFK